MALHNLEPVKELKPIKHRGACIGALLACIAAIFSTHVGAGDAQRHVVMISVDGLRPEIYLEPARLGISVPNLVQLSRQGSSALRMIPVFPSVTYPGHTTLVTGVYPATHGIAANYRRNGEWYLQAADIEAESLWQAARRKGLTVAIVTWPVSYGADVAYLIPENLTAGAGDVTPLIRAGSTPGLFEQLEDEFGRKIIPSIESDAGGEQLDRMTTQFAAAILRRHKPDLLLVHLLNADHQQHTYGPASAEALRAFEGIDRQIGELVQASRAAGTGNETTFFIVGDHGFVPAHTNINVNGFLLDIGFGKVEQDGSVNPTGVLALPFGGGAAFYLQNQGDREMSSRLVAAVKTELEKRYSGRVKFIPRSELDRLKALPGAVFALVATPGYMFTSAPGSETLMPSRARGMHGYLPANADMATGLIISGGEAGVAGSLGEVRMVDVAPTIAVLLGIELKGAEGNPIDGIAPVAPGSGLPLPQIQ